MRIDLPQCEVSECKYRYDGNCTKPQHFRCTYKEMRDKVAALMSANSSMINEKEEQTTNYLNFGVSCLLIKNENEALKAENAELKARLEKAVELPCKVGDMVYRICPKCNDRMQIALDEGKSACSECAWGACMWGASGEGCTVFGLRDDGSYPAEKCIIVPEKVRWGTFPKIARELNKKIFLTREAAEAQLKELRGEE